MVVDTRTEQLLDRTRKFAVRTVHLFRSLPRSPEAQVLGKQLLRSSTSVAANYRAACRSRSRSEFAAKIGVVAEEADESAFWIEFLSDAGIVKKQRVGELLKEAQELTAIFTASRQTAKRYDWQNNKSGNE
ncbi:MAG TPA: four helix bundle protein [Candidatus Angelobacter sp.]|nr:four helix bundle protein [Candidatus Angelobacter sp.]